MVNELRARDILKEKTPSIEEDNDALTWAMLL
jgi:hypothetical protein